MNKNKLPSLVVLLILTLITVVFWIMFSVYRTYTNKEVSTNVPREILLPISPNLDESTIDIMQTKIYP